MLFNRARAVDYMRRCGLDALVATSATNITYFTDYFCWLDPLFNDFGPMQNRKSLARLERVCEKRCSADFLSCYRGSLHDMIASECSRPAIWREMNSKPANLSFALLMTPNLPMQPA